MTNKALWWTAATAVVGGVIILIIVIVVFFPTILPGPPLDKRVYLAPNSSIQIFTETPVQEVIPIPTESAAQPDSTTPDRCGLFEQSSMKVVYPEWLPGANLVAYFKIPGGVPGLEKPIPGDPGPWEYELNIGEYSSTSCEFIQGYEGRLYCEVPAPSDYSNAVRSMALSVNGCDTPIYENSTAYLPGIEGQKTGGGGGGTSGGSTPCTIGLDQNACVAAGGTYAISICDCP